MNEIERRLLALFKEALPLLPEKEMEEMFELVTHGEPGVGLENFCTQLFEYGVEVPDPFLIEITALGLAMGIQSHYWEKLKDGN